MGLDVSHDCWSGSYVAFHRWRCRIAGLAGFPPLEIMQDFWPMIANEERYLPLTGSLGAGGVRSWARDQLVLEYFRRGLLPLKWEDLGDHVGDARLVPLLRHSDCDGEIPPEQCGPIADALEALLPRLDPSPEPDRPQRADYDGSRAATQRFIAGLRKAAAAGEPVRFF